jgi:hypothetical protein
VTFAPVSPEVMQSAQLFSGASFAAFLFVGFLPQRLRWLRWVVLGLYALGAVGFVVYGFLG